MEKQNHPTIIVFLLCFLGFVIAHDKVSPNDYIEQDRFLRKHLPPYLSKSAVENLLLSMKGKLYEQYLKGTLPGSHFYHSDVTHLRNSSNGDTIEGSSSGDNDIRETLCYQLIAKTKTDLQLGRIYASYMDDSNGREESGLLKGNYRWLGRYFECQGKTDGESITAKMCLVTHGNDETGAVGLQSGLCVPDVCTEDQIARLYKEFLLPDFQYASANCPTKVPWTPVGIALVVIISILLLLVLTGTTLEAIHGVDGLQSSRFSKLLICFSARRNTNLLFNTKRKESAIPVLDGIRFLSMTWVILGHTLSISLSFSDNVLDTTNYYLNHFGSLAIANGTLSVDSFFFLSGLLVTYLALRRMKRSSGKLNIPLMYFQRYLRLTPTLILTIMFAMSLFQMIGVGLRYQSINSVFIDLCQEYWWTNLIYINNLYPAELGDECAGWTWYLGNDFQFFVAAPLFIYILYRKPRVGMIALGVGLLGSMAITGALSNYYEVKPDVYVYSVLFRIFAVASYPVLGNAVPETFARQSVDQNNLPSLGLQQNDYFDDTYGKPWCRIGVYFIGMATGYILYATKRKIKINKIYVIQLWVVVAAVELAVVYGWWGQVNSLEQAPSNGVFAFYEAMKRPLWGFGLMWIVIACSTGYGGPINDILSWKGFVPLSRLTFSTYMFHFFVILFMYSSREEDVHFGVSIYIYYFFAGLVLSMLGGYVIFIILEAPIAEIQKLLLAKSNSTSADRTTELQNNNDDHHTVAFGNEVYENETTLGDDVDLDKL